ncbi:hypothetical protein ACJX0J_042493, partial [Zea mays]
CMVVTNLIEKKVVQFSSRGSVSVKADDDNDLLLKPPQKSKPAGATLDNREKVRELLDAVLEKAEKLEASSFGNADGGNLGSRQSNVSMSNGPGPTAVEEGDNSRKTKTLKSVWRKGNPVPTVRKVIREQPRTETRSQSIPVAKPSVSSASKPSPLLLSKPSSDTSKEKKGPILIDKFASKRAAVDPIVPEELLDPYYIIFMFISQTPEITGDMQANFINEVIQSDIILQWILCFIIMFI